MFGMPLQVKGFDMSQWLRFTQPRRIRHGRVSSKIDEHAVCSDSALSAIAQRDMNGERGDERAVAEDEFISRAAKLIEMDFDERVDHFAFARVDLRHIDGRWPGLNPKLPMAGYQRSDFGRIDDVLARQTRHIGTGPADIFPLNDGGSFSCLGHVPGHDLASGAGSEHNHVVLFSQAHNSFPAKEVTCAIDQDLGRKRLPQIERAGQWFGARGFYSVRSLMKFVFLPRRQDNGLEIARERYRGRTADALARACNDGDGFSWHLTL